MRTASTPAEVEQQPALGAYRAQPQLARAADHVVEHLVERELVAARPARHGAADLGAVAAQEGRRALVVPVARRVGEDAAQVAVPGVGVVHRVLLSLLVVVLAQRLPELRERVDLHARAHARARALQLLHQLVDVLELLQRRPAGVAPPPDVARLEPHREGLGEVLVGMALRVVEAQVLHEAPARGVRAVDLGVALRRAAEVPAPARAGGAARRRAGARGRTRGAGCAGTRRACRPPPRASCCARGA